LSARDDILEAADRLFGERGFDATTTREIAAACRVNKALIHYHFANKGTLFGAVLDRYYEHLEAALREALREKGSVRDRLWHALDVYTDFLAANGNFSRLIQREVAGGAHVERIIASMVPIFATGVDMLRQHYPATSKGALSGAQLLISFYGMVVSYFTYSPVLEGLLAEPPLSSRSLQQRKRHLHRMFDLAVDALEAGATRPQRRIRKGARR